LTDRPLRLGGSDGGCSRRALRGYLDHIVSPLQTGALLYLLAFGMIASWRARMLIGYRRLTMRP
jgi:membrane protein CcdC involved in cytochrome C biogenesis